MIEVMPSAEARRLYEDQIPSFMSVFDLDAETMADRDTVTLVDPKMVDMDPKTLPLDAPTQQPSREHETLHPDQTHRHHDSTSTQMSESTNSSPTTTMSTTDSSPLSDPSPSSSPDSPVNLIPLNTCSSATLSAPPTASNSNTLSIPESHTLTRPLTSPNPRKPRNMKGLSIQPPFGPAATSNCVATEPSTPSFIKPNIPAMKRKPSQLSLKTNTSDLMNKSALEGSASPVIQVMPPILQRRAIKHSMSQPLLMDAMKSSTFGPSGGMTFPKVLERNESGLSEVLRPTKSNPVSLDLDESIVEEDSPIKTQLANRHGSEPFHECANNEDQKSPGYPDGPVAIYGDDVYLYLEPTAEEASRFDVVINVAHEVPNPFGNMQNSCGQTLPQECSSSETTMTITNLSTAFDSQLSEEAAVETPTTPKANPLHVPEYIHIPWDHNTDIAPDLMKLCETIERRTKDGKKVLVHCQQGASRSASLIIAYGLYQNPELSVNDAYYAAQAKSRWISPNMKLMYSLQDFHKQLSSKRSSQSSAYKPRAGRSPANHRLTLSVSAIDSVAKEPRTAPLPGEDHDLNSPTRPRGNSTPGHTISPGPASAPLSYSWKESNDGKTVESAPSEAPVTPSTTAEPDSTLPVLPLLPELPTITLDDLPPRPKTGLALSRPASMMKLGLRAFESPIAFSSSPLRRFQSPTPEEPLGHESTSHSVALSTTYSDHSALLSPRVEAMTLNPLRDVPEVAGMRFVETPPTPTEGPFSPREQPFSYDPFSFFGRMIGFGRPSETADPRSPPTKGEIPISRSIDEVL